MIPYKAQRWWPQSQDQDASFTTPGFGHLPKRQDHFHDQISSSIHPFIFGCLPGAKLDVRLRGYDHGPNIGAPGLSQAEKGTWWPSSRPLPRVWGSPPRVEGQLHLPLQNLEKAAASISASPVSSVQHWLRGVLLTSSGASCG